ncbi:MAG TPA: 16S rRNA (guanine(966)-N(2))-methyltransferase RsmD [Candidatus Binataceae bacterium]
MRGAAPMRVIAGEAHGRRLRAPRGLKTRPATARVRASIFSRLAARTELAGAQVLDLFAGSGSLGLEALSRGAARAVFVDSSRAAAAAIRGNLRVLGLEARAEVAGASVERALAALAARRARFDLVFIDAPYRNDTSAAVLDAIVAGGLLGESAYVVVRRAVRAPEISPAGLEAINVATLGDHRIVLYRAPAAR